MVARDRVIGRIVELSERGLDLKSFWAESTDVIVSAIPHYLGPCWFTFDPATLLVTSHYQEGLPEIPYEWLADEYYADDFNKMADVARSASGVSTLLQATDGDPSRSARYREQIVPYGGEQEMLVGLRTRHGDVWGCLGLYRATGQDEFDEDDLALSRALSPVLAEGARRALLFAEASEPDHPTSPGLIIVGDRWEVESMTPAAEVLLADLPDGDWPNGVLPSSVNAVAGHVLRGVENGGTDDGAFSRVLSRTGRWLALHGSPIVIEGNRRVAVIIEPADPARITPLLMEAYRLTEREQEVTRLVLRGASTIEIAGALFISQATVQQHLKSIFEKTSVRSRRDLVGKVFFAHYEPRVRDNERRASAGAAIRGGPAPLTTTGAG